jgi:ribonucleoside-diphosphate reductase alpha chain
MTAADPLTADIAREVWAAKYRAPGETSVADTWRRVAAAVAAAEGKQAGEWARRFEALLCGFRFLPGGRILAGAGTNRDVTLFNCFVMGVIDDSMEGIFEALKEGALTMQRGGGVGYDFSTLRPAGVPAAATGTIASGPVSFMRIWDAMCGTMLSTGARRGAMMATLRCDHPDIETFVEAKRDPRALRNFNVSVQVSDAFMRAVQADRDWALVFPAGEHDGGGERVQRRWTGAPGPVACRVHRRIRARDLWERIARAAYECAEPGVLFTDRINAENNLHYIEQLSATNPCGEVPLPPYGACDLGSLNLAAFVQHPFGAHARFDAESLLALVPAAVRFLDNVIDVSRYPLEAQQAQARQTRRLGLGLTGLADALAMLGLRYDAQEGRAFAAGLLQDIRDAAYRASVELAREKGPFPCFERGAFIQGHFVQRLPDELRDAIARHGIRNSHLLAIAPAGTISLLANNVSSGIEPVFAREAERAVLQADGERRTYAVQDQAWDAWQRVHPGQAPPAALLEAADIAPAAQLAMQAALQPHVDQAISKTINAPGGTSFDTFAGLYTQAWQAGLKGCTVFRPNPITGAVLSTPTPVLCRDPERECD